MNNSAAGEFALNIESGITNNRENAPPNAAQGRACDH